MNFRLLFLILFYCVPYFSPLIENKNDEIINKINIVSEGKAPGSAIAIKLAKKYQSEDVRFCISGECIKLKNKWQLLATKVDGTDRPAALIEDPTQGWFLTNIHLEKNLFQLRAPAKLRLPTSVRAKIENRDQEVEKERQYNLAILKTVTDRPWPCQWQFPLSSVQVSQFGSTRTLPTGVVYSHKGLDLRAQKPTGVRAVADGVVLSADEQIVSGNVINIDHGQGLISRYFHLSKFKVQKNDEVKMGDVIARSGATGRVEAPHLHWEMRIRGVPVEPASTLRLMSQLCDQE